MYTKAVTPPNVAFRRAGLSVRIRRARANMGVLV
eukprot:XP_001705302.1 Hypothetical protein GL50803_35572 [Giardia lamblia ATCC 50803]